MFLVVSREEGESWRDAVKRVAAKRCLADECLASYDNEIAHGVDEAAAAWNALYEWDCLDLKEGDES